MTIDTSLAAVIYSVLDLIGRGKEHLLEEWADGFRGELKNVLREIRSYPAKFRSPEAGDEIGWSVYLIDAGARPVPTWSVSARIPQFGGGLSDLSVQLEISRHEDRLAVFFSDVLVE